MMLEKSDTVETSKRYCNVPTAPVWVELFTVRVGQPTALVPSAGDTGVGALMTIGAGVGVVGVLVFVALPEQAPSANTSAHTPARRMVCICINFLGFRCRDRAGNLPATSANRVRQPRPTVKHLLG